MNIKLFSSIHDWQEIPRIPRGTRHIALNLLDNTYKHASKRQNVLKLRTSVEDVKQLTCELYWLNDTNWSSSISGTGNWAMENGIAERGCYFQCQFVSQFNKHNYANEVIELYDWPLRDMYAQLRRELIHVYRNRAGFWQWNVVSCFSLLRN